MHVHQGLVQFGEQEGAPCVDFSLGRFDSSEEVVRQIHEARKPGHYFLNLGAAYWADEGLDDVLLAIQSDPRTAELPLLSRRTMDGGRWPSVSALWQLDLSRFLSERAPMYDVLKKITEAGFFPQIYEAIIRDPDQLNISPHLLDEIYVRLQPSGYGWIYLSDEKECFMDEMVRAVSKSDTPWRCRRYHAKKTRC